eukprot:TRINITY_DN7299_c0_g1_i4.p1 TRINITY_DN7299_c0_g1~~TRINITY_DN7299_c0_g1_i4.p1  ORF type:complete len:327 (+),score=57.44 TRINITY_DN7299_c0_g1_i4:164-1144(+)
MSFLLVLLALLALPSSGLRVGIVGASFAGCSTAYHISQLLPSAEITLFEREGQVMPENGTFYSYNVAKEVSESFGILARHLSSPEDTGIFNGTELVSVDSGLSALMTWWRYGLSLYKLSTSTETFGILEKIQTSNMTWNSPRDLVKRLNLLKIRKTAFGSFLSEKGASELFISEYVNGISRRYFSVGSQEISALAGLFVYTTTSSWSPEKGILNLMRKMIQASGANLKFSTTVKAITLDLEVVTEVPEKLPEEEVLYNVRTDVGQFSFDAVIIACDFGKKRDGQDIRLSSPLSNQQIPLYGSFFSTWVHGFLRTSFFGLKKTSSPT